MNQNGRILTTHVGSLPRPDDLVEIMFAREDGIPIDRVALEEPVDRAVDEAVARQVAAGVDIVNDGEWPKPSYATYIKDRLNGFGGSGTSYVCQDLEDFPRSNSRMEADPGRKHRKTPACNAAITVKDMDAPRTDAARLKAAALKHAAVGSFMSAASPGVVGLFFRNDHYPDHESYIFALAEARRHEYEAIVDAGILLQVELPGPGDGAAHAVPGAVARGVPRTDGTANRGPEPRAREHSRREGGHAPVLGQLSIAMYPSRSYRSPKLPLKA